MFLGLLITVTFFLSPHDTFGSSHTNSHTSFDCELSLPEVGVVFGEQYDPDLGLYYLRARFYDSVSGRFWSADSWEGDENSPLTLHKYLYTEGNPINRVDPSGKFGVVFGGSTISISLGAYLSATAASFVVGKATEAAVSYSIAGDFGYFEWLSSWDLLNLIPGAAFAKISQNVKLAAGALVSRLGNGRLAGKFAVTSSGKSGSEMIAEAFVHAHGSKTLQTGVGSVLLRGGSTNADVGMIHIARRHLLPYWDGTLPRASPHQSFWPLDTTPEKLVKYLGEVAGQVTNVGRNDVVLSNGIEAVVFVRDGLVKTFYPKSGPGVVRYDRVADAIN
jgi:RHS repeat-associated protein